MARSFAGSISSVITGPTTSTGFSSGVSWSASAWFYPTALPGAGSFAGIFSKRAVGTLFEIFLQNVAGTTGFGAYNGTNFKEFGTISTDQWYHGLAACDGTSAIIYLNGTPAGTDPLDYTSGAGTGDKISIGEDGVGNCFTGRIADCAFWSGVKLTAQEAAALAAGARPNTIRPQSIVIWYPVDGLESPEPDLGSRAYNGVLTGTTAANGPPITLFTPKPPSRFDISAPISILAMQQIGANFSRKVKTIGY